MFFLVDKCDSLRQFTKHDLMSALFRKDELEVMQVYHDLKRQRATIRISAIERESGDGRSFNIIAYEQKTGKQCVFHVNTVD